MVASIGKMASAEYYLNEQESHRNPYQYYTGGAEPDGRWFDPNDLLSEWRGDDGADDVPEIASRGPGRPRVRGPQGELFPEDAPARDIDPGEMSLRDGARVDAAAFAAIYNGFAPNGSGQKLTKNAGQKGRAAGVDVTFSADKSISALWAIADQETRETIERAHNDAVRAALREIIMRECSFTRARADGGRGDVEIVPAKILAALFQHGASRENDPQLHTHACFFNAAKGEDGRWRALYRGRPWYKWKMAVGAVYRMQLADNLQERLGVQMERYGRGRAFTRIVGMPDDLLARWSTRRRMMAAAAAAGGWSISDNAARGSLVNLATRASKSLFGTGAAGRFTRWKEEAAELVEDLGALVGRVTGRRAEITAEDVRGFTQDVRDIPDSLTVDSAVFGLPDICERAANAGAGITDIAAWRTSVQRVLRSDGAVELDIRERSRDSGAGLSCTRLFSTRSMIGLEADVHTLAEAAVADERYEIPRAVVAQYLMDRRTGGGQMLSQEQQDALMAATRGGRVAIIEGAAGSGKTTTLRALADVYRGAGYRMVGAAVPWRVAVMLGEETGIEPLSVARLLYRAGTGEVEVDDKTVVIVDEASMLSTTDMHSIMRLSEQTGVKIVLCGDTAQQQAVEAGPGLRLVRDKAGSSEVRTIRRQLPDIEDILVNVEGLDPATARLHVAYLPEGEAERRVADYFAMEPGLRPPFKPWQVEASEAFADGRAGEAVAAYALRKRLHLGADVVETVKALADDWAKWRAESPGQSGVVLARTHREVEALTFELRGRKLAGAEGARRAVVGGCRDHRDNRIALDVAVGDILRLGVTDVDKGLYNGTTVEVLDLDPAEGRDGEPQLLLRCRDEYGREIEVDTNDLRDREGAVRLTYGYASTITAAQGMTVDRAFLFTDDRAARETIYPAATRHRIRLDIYVDRGPVELAVAARRPEDRWGEEVGDDEIREHLGAAWSRMAPNVAAHDHMSAALRRKVAAARGAPDGGGGGWRRVAGGLALARMEARHGIQLSAIAHDCQVAVNAYDHYRRQYGRHGRMVAAEPGFLAAVRRGRSVLRDVAEFRDERYDALLQAHGMSMELINDLEATTRRASGWRRSVMGEISRRGGWQAGGDNGMGLRGGGGEGAEAAEATPASWPEPPSDALGGVQDLVAGGPEAVGPDAGVGGDSPGVADLGGPPIDAYADDLGRADEQDLDHDLAAERFGRDTDPWQGEALEPDEGDLVGPTDEVGPDGLPAPRAPDIHPDAGLDAPNDARDDGGRDDRPRRPRRERTLSMGGDE